MKNKYISVNMNSTTKTKAISKGLLFLKNENDFPKLNAQLHNLSFSFSRKVFALFFLLVFILSRAYSILCFFNSSCLFLSAIKRLTAPAELSKALMSSLLSAIARKPLNLSTRLLLPFFILESFSSRYIFAAANDCFIDLSKGILETHPKIVKFGAGLYNFSEGKLSFSSTKIIS